MEKNNTDSKNSIKALDMTKGPLNKEIFAFSIPLIFTNLLQVLFNMADMAVVGRFAGASALGSVGSTTNMVVMFIGLLIGIGSGVSALVARFFGARSEKEVKETVSTAFVLSLALGILLMLIGLLFGGNILKLLNTKEELFDGALLYINIYFCCLPAVSLYNFGNGVLSAIGNTKTSLKYLTIAGVLNVILNLFFVIVLKMDVAGVAIATVLTQYLSAFLIIRYLLKINDIYALNFKDFKFNKSLGKKFLALGLPAGAQNAIFQIANMFIQAGVNSFDAVVVEGNAAASNADPLVYQVMASFYVACTSFISQNYGAGNKKRMLQSYLYSTLYSFLIALILGVALVICGTRFLSLFATDPYVLDAGMQRLFVMGFSYCISAFMDNTIAASRGLGRTGIPTIIVILGSCVFRVAWVYTIFAHFHTITSLYLLYAFSWTITAIAEIVYFAYVWKHDEIILKCKA